MRLSGTLRVCAIVVSFGAASVTVHGQSPPPAPITIYNRAEHAPTRLNQNADVGSASQNAASACVVSSVPQAEMTVNSLGEPTPSIKNRFLSFSAGDAGRMQAIRVIPTTMPPGFESFIGQTMWVGPPFDVSETPSLNDNTPPTFKAATLQCTPFYTDWSSLGIVHVFHEVIVPSKLVTVAGPLDIPANYLIQVIDSECSTGSELDYSEPLILRTSGWGDIGNLSVGMLAAPDDRVSVFDIVLTVEAYVGEARATKPWFLLDPATVDLKVTLGDITAAINAFADIGGYPYAPPAGLCPTCGNGAREAGEQCDDGGTVSGDGCDSDCQIEPGGGTAVFSLVPVGSQGSSIINGNEITLAGGDRVELELRLRDWDPGATGIMLESFQAQIDADGYSSGAAGTLQPAPVACASDTDCRTAFGGTCSISGGSCLTNADCPFAPSELCEGSQCDYPTGVGGFCEPGVQFTGRSDYVFATGSFIDIIDMSTLSFRYGASVQFGTGISDPGISQYVGTLFVDVPLDAEGTFTIGFKPGTSETFLLDDNNAPIPYGSLEPALITVNAAPLGCCLPDATCSEHSPSECDALNGIVIPICGGDGNGDGLDDVCAQIIPPGTDCWRTTCGSTKASFCDNPIPADFFGPGSEPFTGSILLGGSGGGDYDTAVQRYDQMQFNGPGSQASTSIELIELHLVSCEPISVDVDGGATTLLWNVSVGLSSATPPPFGSMTATKTHDNGGLFHSTFSVQPVFTFTRVDDPSDIRILDTAQASMPPIELSTLEDAPWVHRPAPGNTVFTCGQNFAPGVYEDETTGDQCCRQVGHAGPGHIHVTGPPDCSACPDGACCLGDGTCQVVSASGPQTAEDVCVDNLAGTYFGDGTDCSDDDGDGIANVQESGDCCGVKDACHTGTDPSQTDTDGDGCSDGAELAGGTDPCDRCDYGPACVDLSTDCNGTGVPDVCDIETGASEDCNTNEIPDECEMGACCGESVSTGTPACVTSTMAECEALTPPGTFLGPCKTCPPQQTSIAYHGTDLIIHSVGTPKECPQDGEKAQQSCVPGAVKVDPWVTKEANGGNPQVCHNFGAAGEAIPSGFFGPNSDTFTDPVCLKGVALGIAPYPEADTLIERTVDPFNRCELPSPVVVNVDVQIAALKMHSLAPITVTYGGGQNPELWDVDVQLSDAPQQIGTLSAIKTSCNGGRYSATYLPVQPKFVFTKVSDPATQVVLDRADTGLPPVPLAMQNLFSADASPWVHDVDPNLGAQIDTCSDFHPGIADLTQTASCDCNGNLSWDRCDIESGVSADCNANGIPDECEIPVSSGGLCQSNCDDDCDANGVPDVCDPDCNDNDLPDACDLAAGTSQDCGPNGIPDECEPDCNTNDIPDACDIRDLTSVDCNGNGVPDECEPDCNHNSVADSCDLISTFSLDLDANGVPDDCQCFGTTSEPELIDDGTGQFVVSNKMRWISLSAAGVTGGKQAIRVTFVDLPAPFDELNGTRMWVGAPEDVSVLSGKGLFDDPGDDETFLAAQLQCTPFFRDWSGDGIVHVYHEYLIPNGVYLAEVMDEGCAKNLASSYTSSVEFTNAKWGDPVGLVEGVFVAPDGVTSVFDTLAMVASFSNDASAPDKVRTEMLGVDLLAGPNAVIDGKIGVSEIVAVLQEFSTGDGYPFLPGGAPCP